jgi:hypothetical protein
MAHTNLTPSESFAKWLATGAPSGRPQIGRRATPFDYQREIAKRDRYDAIATAAQRAQGYAANGHPIPLDFNYED